MERQFEIIGDALNQALHLDPSLAARISDASRIIAFRNRLIHAYASIADEKQRTFCHSVLMSAPPGPPSGTRRKSCLAQGIPRAPRARRQHLPGCAGPRAGAASRGSRSGWTRPAGRGPGGAARVAAVTLQCPGGC